MFRKMFRNYYYLQSQLLVGLFAPHGASLMRLLVPRLHNPGYNMLDTKDKMVKDGFPNHGYNMLDTKDKMVEDGFHNPGYNMLDTKDKMVEDGFPNHGYNTDVVALILCYG